MLQMWAYDVCFKVQSSARSVCLESWLPIYLLSNRLAFDLLLRPLTSIFRRVQEYGHRHRWMAFIDSDEFFVIRDGTANLPTLLQDYVKYGGLGVFWVVFGSSGHIKRPAHGLMGSYYRQIKLYTLPISTRLCLSNGIQFLVLGL